MRAPLQQSKIPVCCNPLDQTRRRAAAVMMCSVNENSLYMPHSSHVIGPDHVSAAVCDFNTTSSYLHTIIIHSMHFGM